jgi:MFS family permease
MRRLPRQVVLLGWISLLADVSGEMTAPLMPLYLTGVLGAGTLALGVVEGCSEAVVTGMKALAGWHSDKAGRRVPYIRWGYGLPVLGKAIIAAAMAWPMVGAGRVLDRLGKGIRTTPRDALLADAAPPESRGHAFGLHRAMDTAGALAGALLAAAMLAALGAQATPSDASAWRWTLALAALTGVGCWTLTFLLRDVGSESDTDTRVGARDATPMPRAFWRSTAALCLFALGNSSDAFLLLRASQLGLGPVQVVLAYAIFNAVYAVASLPAGRLSDHAGRGAVLRTGWLLQGVSYLGFAFASRGWHCFTLMALYGLAVACHEGVGKALVADAAPAGRRGTAMSIAFGCMGASALAASVGAGWIWQHAGPAWALGLGLFTATAASLALPMRTPAADSRP